MNVALFRRFADVKLEAGSLSGKNMNAPQIDIGRVIRKDRRPRSAAVRVPG